MSKNWTAQQLDAINSRNGSILVSAAAGSGKTAVLVQRVIERLTSQTDRTTADRLLIVTFTRAAASEMKERISAAIEDKIRQNPDDINLINQQMLLPLAKICTIDSFCNSLVRENFQFLDIPADFKNADEGELKIIKKAAIDKTLMDLYEKGEPEFLDLVEFLFKGRDDSYLASVIMQLYESSMSFAFANKWLDDLILPFDTQAEISDSHYGKILFDYINEAIFYCYQLCLDEDYYDAFANIYLDSMSKTKDSLNEILTHCKNHEWDLMKDAILAFKIPTKKRKPKDVAAEDLIELDQKRDEIKAVFKKKLAPLMVSTQSEYVQDMQFFLPHVKKLVRCAKQYGENFINMKLEKKFVDFSDITQMTLRLLVTQDADSYKPTPLAEKLRLDFDEILIDEYQDTNKAQDMIFTSISNNNLFRVGDVKQSIYKFRQAMPEIFIDLKLSYKQYEKEKDEYPAKIILGSNFRSRKEITDSINFVFTQLMSQKMGDIDYNSEEQLNGVISAIDDTAEEKNFSLMLLAMEKDQDRMQNEVEATVAMVHKMVTCGEMIDDGATRRPVNYGDFCIMLRSVNGGRGAMYAEKFRELEIPTFVEFTTEFFTSMEISMILSLLRVVDNPKQDVPLLALMHSPIFGFSVDEISAIKIAQRKGSYYSAVMTLAQGENEENQQALIKLLGEKAYQNLKAKVINFTQAIKQYTTLSVCLGTGELISLLYDETSLMCIADAVDSSGIKRANLQLFLQYAKTYEALGYVGLSGFIRFIDRLGETKSDLPNSLGNSQNAQMVQIMTIHKSKGLEFPICILANCSGKFNQMDERKNVIVSLKHGLGLIKRNAETFEQFPTLSHSALKLAQRLDNLSEELRVLYVAMTRAKQRLIMIHSSKTMEKSLNNAIMKINSTGEKSPPFLVASGTCFSDWLLTALLRHQNAAAVLDKFEDVSKVKVATYDAKIHVEKLENDYQTQKELVLAKSNNDSKAQIDQSQIQFWLDKFTDDFSFEYEYEKLTMLTSKRAASEQDDDMIDEKYFATARPSFMNENEMTGAQKGIITHEFVQYADFKAGAINVQAEIDRLVEKGFILKDKAKGINKQAVKKFFYSDIVRRINESELVFKEKKFTFEEPVSVRGEEFEQFTDEKIMVQGIADCVFVEDAQLVIIDYKTDKVKDEAELAQKYKAQVDTYASALSVCMGMKVKQSLLYSFYLGKEITVYKAK